MLCLASLAAFRSLCQPFLDGSLCQASVVLVLAFFPKSVFLLIIRDAELACNVCDLSSWVSCCGIITIVTTERIALGRRVDNNLLHASPRDAYALVSPHINGALRRWSIDEGHCSDIGSDVWIVFEGVRLLNVLLLSRAILMLPALLVLKQALLQLHQIAVAWGRVSD